MNLRERAWLVVTELELAAEANQGMVGPEQVAEAVMRHAVTGADAERLSLEVARLLKADFGVPIEVPPPRWVVPTAVLAGLALWAAIIAVAALVFRMI